MDVKNQCCGITLTRQLTCFHWKKIPEGVHIPCKGFTEKDLNSTYRQKGFYCFFRFFSFILFVRSKSFLLFFHLSFIHMSILVRFTFQIYFMKFHQLKIEIILWIGLICIYDTPAHICRNSHVNVIQIFRISFLQSVQFLSVRGINELMHIWESYGKFNFWFICQINKTVFKLRSQFITSINFHVYISQICFYYT